MGKSVAEVRKINRERRARQRAALRDAGVPTTAKVHAAIGEATSFAMRAGVKDAGVNISGVGPHLWIDSVVVMETAVEILTKRWRYDLKHSRRAVAAVVSPRPEHLWPEFVPTHTLPVRDGLAA